MARRNPRCPRTPRPTRSPRHYHPATPFLEALESRLLLEGSTFVHPGVLDTSADFTRMATKVAAGEQPWLDGWNKLLSNGWAHLGMQPGPVATITRGDTNNSYIMWSQIDQCYNSAIIWKVTGDTRYADQAVSFLNAWASVNTSVTGNSNVALALGLYGFQWANVAEIMRTYSGWAAADQTKFQNYLLNVFVPGIHNYLGLDGYTHWGSDPTHYWANWDLCNMGALMAIGVFCDRHDLYQEGLNYVYTGIGNGAFDKVIYYMHPGNQGQGQEAGRDQGHASLDFALLGQICQTAWNQGDDLFSYKNNEILAGVEYLAKYALGNDVPFVWYASNTSGPWGAPETTIAGPQGLYRPIFELFYNHYVTMEGLSAPYTTQALMQHTRPEGDWGNGDEYSWGTLLFALDPDPTIHAPQDLVAYKKGAGNIQLNWWGGANDTSFNVYRATSAAGPYTLIASGIPITSTTYTDQNLPAGTYYYKVTGVSGATETAPTNIVQALSNTTLFSQFNFDESGGTTASDSVGTLTGTLNGGAAFAPGKSGNALSLDGSSGYLSLPAGAISNLSDFTISTWVYLNTSQTWARIFDFGDSRGDWMFLTPNSGNGTLEFATGTTYNYNKESIDAPALPTNQWVHVAVTFTNRLATLYVNGVAVGSNANMDFPPYEINGGMPNSWIGRSQYSADPYLNAKVDDFRIYSGALTTGQVYTLATGNTPPAVPGAPTTLSAAAVPGNQINLGWSGVSGATSYSVYRSTTAGGPYVPVATLVTGTTYADTGLTADTRYYYVVTAADNGGEGSSSPEASATALPPMPAIPANLTAKGISATAIGLSWTAAASAYTYNIYRSTTSGGPYTLIASNIGGTSYNDTSLTTGTPYYYVVSSVNTAGQSADSNEAFATPSALYLQLKFDETAGTAAQDTAGNNDNGTLLNGPLWDTGKINGSVHLNSASSEYVSLPTGVVSSLTSFTIAAWVNPDSLANWARIFDFGSGTATNMFLTPQNGSNGYLRFGIKYNNSAEQQINTTTKIPVGAWTHVAVTLNGSLGILYVNGVEVGRNASFTLNPSSLGSTSQNWIGRSQYADPYFNGRIDDFRIYSQALTAAQIQALATTARPAAPTGVTASASAPNQIDLSWNAVAGATGYNVLRSATPGGPYTTIATHLTSTSYSDTGLAADITTGTPYYYVLSAEDAGGDSPYSAETNATALPPVPAAITDLSALPGTSGAINLTWSAPSDAVSYSIRRATWPDGPYTTIATGLTATSYADSGLADGTTYYYLVDALNAGGTSGDSNAASATATDLSLRYRFDDASGTTASDASGHLLTGTLVNGATLDAHGKINSAVSLNGSSQYVQLPSGTLKSLTAVTVSAWVNLNAITNWTRIFDFGAGTSDYMFLTPDAGGTNKVRFAITTAGNTAEQQINGTSALPTGSWVHVAVTLSGSTGILYVNGVQVGINTAMALNPSSLGNTTLNYLGKSQFNDPYLNGRIDDFRIYSRALSASEINALATTTQPSAAPTGLTAIPGNAEVQLSWNPVPGASGYDLYRATTSGGPYTLLAGHLAATSYTDASVSDGTSYFYVVRAYNILDEGAASTEASATPDTPALLTVSNLNDSGAGSLRQAISDANALRGTFLLQFASGLSGTLALASPLPALAANITLAANAPGAINIQGAGTLLTIPAGVNAALQNLSFASGTLDNEGHLQILGQSSLNILTGNGQLAIGTASAAATLTLAPLYGVTSSQSALAIAPGSTFDIADQGFLLSYGAGAPDPAAPILSQLRAGAILSSTVSANARLGIAFSDNTATAQILLQCDLLGDANMDGQVDANDLSIVLNNFGKATPNWTSGNFDHAATIDLTDISDALNNSGQSMAALGFSPSTATSASSLSTGSTPQQPTTIDPTPAPAPSSTTDAGAASDTPPAPAAPPTLLAPIAPLKPTSTGMTPPALPSAPPAPPESTPIHGHHHANASKPKKHHPHHATTSAHKKKSTPTHRHPRRR